MQTSLAIAAVERQFIPPGPAQARQRGRSVFKVTNPADQLKSADAVAKPEMVDLLQRVAAERCRTAFSALFIHFAPRVKAYLMRSGASQEVAEDLAQETLLRVWRKAHQFDPAIAAPATWIFRIARNVRIDALRRSHRPELDPEDPALVRDQDPPADEQIDAAQQRERVLAVLDTLPADQKQVLMLSFFEDKPHSVIAEQLGLPLGTVKSRIRLAFARTRKALGEKA